MSGVYIARLTRLDVPQDANWRLDNSQYPMQFHFFDKDEIWSYKNNSHLKI